MIFSGFFRRQLGPLRSSPTRRLWVLDPVRRLRHEPLEQRRLLSLSAVGDALDEVTDESALVADGPTRLAVSGLANLQPIIVAGDPGGTPSDSPANRVDPNTTASPYGGVGSLYVQTSPTGGYIGSATAIDPYHVLTAAHMIDLDNNGSIDVAPGDVRFILNYGSDLSHQIFAGGLFIHPDWTGFNKPSVNDDVAVIKLSTALPAGVPIYPLHRDPFGPVEEVTLVGYGTSGDGVTGYYVDPAFEVKRVGANLTDFFDTGDEFGDGIEVFEYDFDGPGVDDRGNIGLANDVETTLGGGDSGGPAFVDVGGHLEVYGINTFTFSFGLFAPAAPFFGSGGGGMVVAEYADWIDSIVAGQPAEDSFDYPISETPVHGTVSGSYLNTAASDDVYQRITERHSGGRPSNRYDWLEHQWAFDVTGGTSVEFAVEAHHDDTGESFQFEYWTGLEWTLLLKVTKTADDDTVETASMPASTNGNVLVRLVDLNSSPSGPTAGTVSIDQMFFHSVAAPALDNDVAITAISAPASVEVDTIVSVDATVKNVGANETGLFDVMLRDGVGGSVIDTRTITNLTPGAVQQLTFSWDTSGEGLGNHELVVSHNRLPDGNALNNSMSTTVNVHEPIPASANNIYVSAIDFAQKDYGRGGATHDLMTTVTVHRDADGDGVAEPTTNDDEVVADATVLMDLSRDGNTRSFQGTTDSLGQVTFTLKRAIQGTEYKAEVTGISHGTYIYEWELNVETDDLHTVSAPTGKARSHSVGDTASAARQFVTVGMFQSDNPVAALASFPGAPDALAVAAADFLVASPEPDATLFSRLDRPLDVLGQQARGFLDGQIEKSPTARQTAIGSSTLRWFESDALELEFHDRPAAPVWAEAVDLFLGDLLEEMQLPGTLLPV